MLQWVNKTFEILHSKLLSGSARMVSETLAIKAYGLLTTGVVAIDALIKQTNLYTVLVHV